MVVIYRLSPVSYRLGRRFLRVENVAMVNLIAGRRIVPELIQDDCTPERIAGEALSLLTRSAESRRDPRRALADVRARLGAPGSQRSRCRCGARGGAFEIVTCERCFDTISGMSSANSFGTCTQCTLGGESVEIFSLSRLEPAFPGVARLPYSLKILLENLLRHEDRRFVDSRDIEALAGWKPGAKLDQEISFAPARVLLQDFTGVPCVVDLAAMRDGIIRLGGNPDRVNPLQPVELVIDHSVQVDYYGRADAFQLNAELEFVRNRERYSFLRWGQDAFRNFRVVPPDTGIVHQVNIEYLARVVFRDVVDGRVRAYPDTLVGTDSHTTMVNGLGVLGWGVGGIEAEAAMLGQPMSMLIPPVLGFKLDGRHARGRHGHRPGPDGDRAPAEARRRRQVRRILRPGSRRTSRSPIAPRSATCVPSTAQQRRCSRSTR